MPTIGTVTVDVKSNKSFLEYFLTHVCEDGLILFRRLELQ